MTAVQATRWRSDSDEAGMAKRMRAIGALEPARKTGHLPLTPTAGAGEENEARTPCTEQLPRPEGSELSGILGGWPAAEQI